MSNGGGNLAATGRWSDPKPREGGRQTQNPERGGKPKTVLHCNPEFLHVVRPKTPRGEET
ncbi:Uncharacterised protein [Mycobacterium tuberculosis]|nr:Uncharacterised protein [Mycobacterium tuberculosis]